MVFLKGGWGMEEAKKEGFGVKFLKVLLVILIPLIFILTATTLFLKLSGFNVNQQVSQLTSKIPVVSTILGTKDKSTPNKGVGSTQVSDTTNLNQQLLDKGRQVSRLESEVQSQQKAINDLNKQISDLKLNNLKAAQAKKTQMAKGRATVISSTYQAMDPQKAAAIFEKMSISEAATDMNLLNNQTKAKIFEYLTPDMAAKLTAQLSSNPYQSTTTTAATTPTTP
jgi:flagellar motility protein MotE (MotC chaperone)